MKLDPPERFLIPVICLCRAKLAESDLGNLQPIITDCSNTAKCLQVVVTTLSAHRIYDTITSLSGSGVPKNQKLGKVFLQSSRHRRLYRTTIKRKAVDGAVGVNIQHT